MYQQQNCQTSLKKARSGKFDRQNPSSNKLNDQDFFDPAHIKMRPFNLKEIQFEEDQEFPIQAEKKNKGAVTKK